MSATAIPTRSRLTAKGAAGVPQITAAFWVIKLLSTAMGASSSDYLVHAMAPALAVLLGFAGFVAALAALLQDEGGDRGRAGRGERVPEYGNDDGGQGERNVA